MKLLIVFLCIFIVGCLAGCSNITVPGQPVNFPVSSGEAQEILDALDVPDGLYVETFAEIPGARSMALGDGYLFVGTRTAGRLYAVELESREVILLGKDMNMPNGVAYIDGDLYVAEVDRILRYDDVIQDLDAPSYEVVFDGLPSDKHHGWKYIAFGPDGKLYVPVGAPCNICDPGDPYASIQRINLTTNESEIIARGVRNTVGFDWGPDGKMWFTDNGRDWLGDDIPPDELNILDEGAHYGYPHCHGADIKDPEFGEDCEGFEKPFAELGPHVAALGVEVYQGEIDILKDKIVIAEHGSWNRKELIGYRLTMVDKNTGEYSVFVDGWLKDGSALGRPVDVLSMDESSLLVSDDHAGLVYKIGKVS